MRIPCIAAVVGELNRAHARHYVDAGDGDGRLTVHWTIPGRAPRTTVIEASTTPQQAVRDVRAQLKRLGVLAEGGRSGIRAWTSDAPPLAPSAPRTPLQLAIDEIASRVAQLSLFGRDPSKFASARSEIVAELRRLARTGAS